MLLLFATKLLIFSSSSISSQTSSSPSNNGVEKSMEELLPSPRFTMECTRRFKVDTTYGRRYKRGCREHDEGRECFSIVLPVKVKHTERQLCRETRELERWLADMMAAVWVRCNYNILNDTLSHLKCMLGGTAIACNATCHVGLTWHRNSLCRSIAFTMMSWTRQYEYTSTVDVLSHDAVSKWWSHKAIIRRLRHVHTFTTTPTTTSVRVNVRWTRMEWYY